MFWLFLVQILLIALNAVFAAAEIAVLSLNDAALEKKANEGNRRAKKLFKLSCEPAKFLATIQVAITLSGFLGSAFAADGFSEPLVAWVQSLGVNIPTAVLDAIAVILITLILSYFTLVFGELVPKRLAMKRAEKVAMGVAGVVSGISVIFKPLVSLLSVSTNLILRLFGIDPNEAEDNVSEEEIKMLVDAGTEKGTIDRHEKEFIQNIFEFNDVLASDIATHRSDVAVLYIEDGDEVWHQTVVENRHSFFPISGESLDDICGVLSSDDYFRLTDRSRENVMKNAVRQAYFVPENIKADVLFKNMKSTKNSIAIVIDEYGSMSGIITFYDLIEILVGDIYENEENTDTEKPHLEKINGNTWKIIGNVRIGELEDEIGMEISSDDHGTVGGLVFDAIGSIPDDGECDITAELDFATVRVIRVDSHVISEAVIILKQKENEEEK